MGGTIIVGNKTQGKTAWARAWQHRCKTRASAKSKRWLKKQAHRAARRGDGHVRLNERDVI